MSVSKHGVTARFWRKKIIEATSFVSRCYFLSRLKLFSFWIRGGSRRVAKFLLENNIFHMKSLYKFCNLSRSAFVVIIYIHIFSLNNQSSKIITDEFTSCQGLVFATSFCHKTLFERRFNVFLNFMDVKTTLCAHWVVKSSIPGRGGG